MTQITETIRKLSTHIRLREAKNASQDEIQTLKTSLRILEQTEGYARELKEIHDTLAGAVKLGDVYFPHIGLSEATRATISTDLTEISPSELSKNAAVLIQLLQSKLENILDPKPQWAPGTLMDIFKDDGPGELVPANGWPATQEVGIVVKDVLHVSAPFASGQGGPGLEGLKRAIERLEDHELTERPGFALAEDWIVIEEDKE